MTNSITSNKTCCAVYESLCISTQGRGSRPLFLGVALVALFFAYRRIYRPVAACLPGEVCALPSTRRIYKILFWMVALLVLVAFTFPYLAPLFY